MTGAVGPSPRARAAGPYFAQTSRDAGPAGRRIGVHVPSTLSHSRIA